MTTHILKHKSWNVYSTKNRERVERDEREHNEKLLKQNQKKIEIESEKRYQQLKSDLKKRKYKDDEEDEDEEDNIINNNNLTTTTTVDNTNIDNSNQHINLFEGITGDQIFSKSKEKKIKQHIVSEGVRLGEGCIDNNPVWIKDNSKKSNNYNNDNNNYDQQDKDERRKRKKEKREKWALDREDPIHIVEKALGKNKSSSSSSKTTPSTTTTTSTTNVNRKKTIDELRKERLEREEKERKRANELKIPNTKSLEGTGAPQSSVSYLAYNGGIKKR